MSVPMALQCPACSTEIRKYAAELLPIPGAVYRCPVCRLELVLNCSAEGFSKAMDVSCHSFIRMAKLGAPLMKEGGSMFAMTYHGA